jgi:hypothetical protein
MNKLEIEYVIRELLAIINMNRELNFLKNGMNI